MNNTHKGILASGILALAVLVPLTCFLCPADPGREADGGKQLTEYVRADVRHSGAVLLEMGEARLIHFQERPRWACRYRLRFPSGRETLYWAFEVKTQGRYVTLPEWSELATQLEAAYLAAK